MRYGGLNRPSSFVSAMSLEVMGVFRTFGLLVLLSLCSALIFLSESFAQSIGPLSCCGCKCPGQQCPPWCSSAIFDYSRCPPCGSGQPTVALPTPTNTPRPTNTLRPAVPTSTPTQWVLPTWTPRKDPPTSTPTPPRPPTWTPTSAPTWTFTQVPLVEATATRTARASPTPTIVVIEPTLPPLPTETATRTPRATNTALNTATPEPSSTPTEVATDTPQPTETPEIEVTIAPTPTPESECWDTSRTAVINPPLDGPLAALRWNPPRPPTNASEDRPVCLAVRSHGCLPGIRGDGCYSYQPYYRGAGCGGIEARLSCQRKPFFADPRAGAEYNAGLVAAE